MKTWSVRRLVEGAIVVMVALSMADAVAADEGAEGLYLTHCAVCHGKDRFGFTGPALLPQNLGRLKKKAAIKVVTDGRAATQMLPFSALLSTEQIASLVDYVYSPLADPKWGEEQIRASHVIHKPELTSGDANSVKPVYDADPLNLFLVVESGDHHVTVLDGDKFEPLLRFKSRFALHGGPKYSSDGRFVYFTSRDGWITKFDMYRLEVVAEIRAGINARNSAVSSNDKYVMVGNYLPNTLVILDAGDLSLIKVIPVVGKDSKASRVSAVYDARPRNSFIAALKDSPEAWEINYENPPPAGFGDAGGGMFPMRRIESKIHLDDFFFDQSYSHLVGASRDGSSVVIDLDLGKVIAEPELPGMPHLASGITWKRGDKTLLATPNLKEGAVTFIDVESWQVVDKVETLGPGFFMRSHENTPYAWVDVFFGPHKDKMHVIDKETLKIVKTLQPVEGKTAAHIEFTRDGRFALLSIWEMDGALIIYDGETLEEVKRIPMKKPVGKYNVFNKTRRSEGTSH